MTLLQARGSNIDLTWFDFPSHLFFSDSTQASWAAAWWAAWHSACLAGSGPAMLALNGCCTGYCVAAETFLGFQWDNLSAESCFIAALLPRTGTSPIAH